MAEEKQVLIVDDSKDSQRFLSEILENHGYRYEIANNGKEALEAMKATRPDLILLDIMMPGRSGVFVFKDIKKDPSYENIPVVFITGASEATGVNVKTGEQAPIRNYSDQYPRGSGAQIFKKLSRIEPEGLVEKPVDPAELIETIKALLS
jgi:twitching motility two-component system response regulator PilH